MKVSAYCTICEGNQNIVSCMFSSYSCASILYVTINSIKMYTNLHLNCQFEFRSGIMSILYLSPKERPRHNTEISKHTRGDDSYKSTYQPYEYSCERLFPGGSTEVPSSWYFQSLAEPSDQRDLFPGDLGIPWYISPTGSIPGQWELSNGWPVLSPVV